MNVFPGGDMLRGLVDGLAGGGSSSDTLPPVEEDRAPSWETLDEMLQKASTEQELGFRQRLADGRGDEANAMATLRLFDAASKDDVRVTLSGRGSTVSGPSSADGDVLSSSSSFTS